MGHVVEHVVENVILTVLAVIITVSLSSGCTDSQDVRAFFEGNKVGTLDGTVLVIELGLLEGSKVGFIIGIDEGILDGNSVRSKK